MNVKELISPETLGSVRSYTDEVTLESGEDRGINTSLRAARANVGGTVAVILYDRVRQLARA